MPAWRPPLYRKHGEEIGVDANLLTNAIATAEITLSINSQLPPVFTLKHLAHLAGVDYGLLRAIVRSIRFSAFANVSHAWVSGVTV